MRPLLTAFLLGAAAFAVLAYGAAVAIALIADTGGWASTRVALGPVTLLAFERTAGVTSTTFGPGLPLAALLGGVVNAAAAAVLRRRARR